MTRPIEYDLANWCTRKEAASMRGRHIDTIDNWIATGQVRSMRDPSGRGILVYVPDFMPPARLPERKQHA
jgi:hypothetical protein